MSNMNQIFKSYIITKNKKPARKYTDPANQYTYDQIQSLPEYAGILSKDAVLVDVDDDLEAELLLGIIKALNVKCRVHRTDRGLHVFFIGHHVDSTRTHITSAIGLTTDWKLGEKNGICILKKDGVEREVVYETDEIGPLPCWLYPVKNTPNFATMGDGDGRNDELFKHILTLQAAGLTKDESRETIEIINRFIFKEPLPERELSTILRDEAFPTESFYDSRGRLQVRKFEEHFCREAHLIKLDGNLHIYNDGVYQNGDEKIRGKMLDYLPDLTGAQRNEILNRSKDRIQYNEVRSEPHLIAFRNGIYDAKSGSMGPHDPNCIITNLIPWDYNPNAYSEVTDRTLNKLACNDPKIRALLEEIVGACMYRSNSLAGGKAFLLLGDASNGKSTYLAMVTNLLGTENISSLSLQDLSARFKPAQLFNKLANIGDDIPETWVPDASMFKKMVTGERISAEFKGLNEFEFPPYSTPLYSANNMPRIEDKTGAVKRRLHPVPFRAVFSPNDPDYDPFIKEKLVKPESMEYLIKLGLEGLNRVLASNKFTITDDIEKELKDIDVLNNPILSFIDDYDRDWFINKNTKEVFDQYRTYCIEAGMNPVALNSFVKQINKRLGLTVIRKMINGQTMKLFEAKKG